MQTALENGKVRSAFPIYYCEKCKKETIYPTCENCESVCNKFDKLVRVLIGKAETIKQAMAHRLPYKEVFPAIKKELEGFNST